MPAHFIDVSHVVAHGTITYPGIPAPSIRDHMSREASRARYASGTEFHIGAIEMVGNTGTYLDAPFHRYADGADLADLSLERVADLLGVVVRCANGAARAIDRSAFSGIPLRHRAVLVHSGWDRHWGTPSYGVGHPFLTRDAAKLLVREGARLVGIDSLNIDDDRDGSRPAHTLLLAAGIPIVEHLCGLDQLPDQGFHFFAVPVKVKGLGSFPVRAFAVLDTGRSSAQKVSSTPIRTSRGGPK